RIGASATHVYPFRPMAAPASQSRFNDSMNDSLIVPVKLGPRSYDVVITSGAAAAFGAFAHERAGGTRAFLVTDANVQPHAQAAAAALQPHFQVTSAILPPGEAQKSLACAAQLYDRLAELQ